MKWIPITNASALEALELYGLTTYTFWNIYFIITYKYERSLLLKNLATNVPPSLNIF